MRHPYRDARAENPAPRTTRDRGFALAVGVVTALAAVRCAVALLRGEWFSSEVALALVIVVVVAVAVLRGRRST